MEDGRNNRPPDWSAADGGLKRVDGGLDAGFGGHREIFHLETDPVVVAHHAHDREKLLPPLQIMARTHGDVVPGAVRHVSDFPEFEEAVHICEAPFDPGIFAVTMVDRPTQRAGSRDWV